MRPSSGSIGHRRAPQCDAQALGRRLRRSLEYAKARILTSERADKAMARLQRLPSFAGSHGPDEDGGRITSMFKDQGSRRRARRGPWSSPCRSRRSCRRVLHARPRALPAPGEQASSRGRRASRDWVTALDPSRQLVVASVVVDDPKPEPAHRGRDRPAGAGRRRRLRVQGADARSDPDRGRTSASASPAASQAGPRPSPGTSRQVRRRSMAPPPGLIVRTHSGRSTAATGCLSAGRRQR